MAPSDIRKIATLLQVLPEEIRRELLADLSDAERLRIKAAIHEGVVTDEVQIERMAQDFLDSYQAKRQPDNPLPRRDDAHAPRDVTGEMDDQFPEATNIENPPDGDSFSGDTALVSNEDPIACFPSQASEAAHDPYAAPLANVPPPRIARYLEGEHPQVAAAILRSLPKGMVDSVLRIFPDGWGRDMRARVPHAESIDVDLTHALRYEFARELSGTSVTSATGS